MDNFHQFVATATALVAIWYTVRESRRNNSPMLKVLKFGTSGCERMDENEGEWFHEIDLLVKNHGVALHSMSAKIRFRDKQGAGLFTVPLSLADNSPAAGSFERGMVARFVIKDYKLGPAEKSMLRRLVDPTKQEASVSLFSCGYLAVEWRCGGWRDRVKSKWNRVARHLNKLFERENQHGVLISPTVMPKAIVFCHPITQFVEWACHPVVSDA